MKVVLQRVNKASVTVNSEIVGKIQKGICVLWGVGSEDDEINGIKKVEALVNKIVNLRIFEDENGKMNLSLLDLKAKHRVGLLIVSQFTLYGDCSKGRRPSFGNAGKPELAKKLYEYAIEYSRKLGVHTESGIFQAEMLVEIHNDGPVTFLLDE